VQDVGVRSTSTICRPSFHCTKPSMKAVPVVRTQNVTAIRTKTNRTVSALLFMLCSALLFDLRFRLHGARPPHAAIDAILMGLRHSAIFFAARFALGVEKITSFQLFNFTSNIGPLRSTKTPYVSSSRCASIHNS
jgi:hypothetical protein